jgi:hypothetical protein
MTPVPDEKVKLAWDAVAPAFTVPDHERLALPSNVLWS